MWSWAAEAGKSLILIGFLKGILMVFAGRHFVEFLSNSGVGQPMLENHQF